MAITFSSNQLSGLEWASWLTLVGLTRVSTGPAMSIMLRGWAGLSLGGHDRSGASAAGHGWQTAITWAPGPMNSRKDMTWPT